MAKAMTKTEIYRTVAEKCGCTRKQVKECLEAVAELAYKQARNGFAVPGLGKLVMVERGPRQMVMRFGPKTGQTVTVPKKKVVRFRVAKAAKDAILGKK